MEILSLLVDRGADLECRTESDRALKAASKDARKRGNRHPGPGCTALTLAAMQGHSDCVVLLLDRKADPNTTDDRGQTPFHHACAAGHAECVQHLCEWQSCNLNIKDSQGRTGDMLIAAEPDSPCHLEGVTSHIKMDRLRDTIKQKQDRQRTEAEAVRRLFPNCVIDKFDNAWSYVAGTCKRAGAASVT